MAELFTTALDKFLARYKRASYRERIYALQKQLAYLEIDADAETQRAQERAYGKQLLMPRPR